MIFQVFLKNILRIILMCVLILSLSGCKKPISKLPVTETSEDNVLEFDTFTVSYRDVKRDIEGLGNLVFYDKATVVSRIDGIIEKIFVKKGKRVKKGEMILELSNHGLELEKIKIEKEVLSKEEELETQKIEYIEEQKNIYKKFFQIEKLQLQIDNYKNEIEFLREHLKRKKILYKKGGITEEELRNLEFSLGSKERELGILKKEYELESYGFRDRRVYCS